MEEIIIITEYDWLETEMQLDDIIVRVILRAILFHASSRLGIEELIT